MISSDIHEYNEIIVSVVSVLSSFVDVKTRTQVMTVLLYQKPTSCILKVPNSAALTSKFVNLHNDPKIIGKSGQQKLELF